MEALLTKRYSSLIIFIYNMFNNRIVIRLVRLNSSHHQNSNIINQLSIWRKLTGYKYCMGEIFILNTRKWQNSRTVNFQLHDRTINFPNTWDPKLRCCLRFSLLGPQNPLLDYLTHSFAEEAVKFVPSVILLLAISPTYRSKLTWQSTAQQLWSGV